MSNSYRKLPHQRAVQVKDLAEAVSNDYSPNGQVDPLSILADHRVTHSFGNYGDAFDGALECSRTNFHVYCNTARTGRPQSPRSRFTLAHELGHYYIDNHRRALLSGPSKLHTSYCEFESNKRVEREADLFATCLLMPTERFQEYAQETSLGIEGILALKDEFGTSVTSTAIRYVKQNLMPCAVIKWHSSEFGWRWVSQSMYERGLGKTLDEIEEVPCDSATALALQDQPPENGLFHQRGGTASFWFPGRQRADDPILIEQSVSLQRFGALTLLYPDPH